MTIGGTVSLISEVRKDNNNLWMQLLQIALENAPVETKKVLRQINNNDRSVSLLLEELAR